MRVAFGIMGGDFWTGGVNYLENLLSAIAERPSLGIDPVLMVGTDADPRRIERLAGYLSSPPVVSAAWDRGRWTRLVRSISAYTLQRDIPVERSLLRERIDVVFQHGAWLGAAFRIPTLAWVADLQHRRHPEMFSFPDRVRRDAGYAALSRCASRIMVSSEDAKRDCEHFFPSSKGRVDAVPFAVRHWIGADDALLSEVRDSHSLPDRFIFFPNQLWLHKNHLGVLLALKRLEDRGGMVDVVACGNPRDYRHPRHPETVIRTIGELGLADRFRFLGLIPGHHILPLMRLSCAVLNPSFHEGWSTTVEEAKAIGVPLLLSDIPIHREQTEGLRARFFDPADVESIADVLCSAMLELPPGPRRDAESQAAIMNQARRDRFARAFADSAVHAAGNGGPCQ
jgi:glycosyltransferase involved in cell wall biosynthesis